MSFKICTIGCGQHASKYHGPSYAQYAATEPDTVLAACCDIDEAKAAKFPLHSNMSQSTNGVIDWTQARLPDGTLNRP